LLGRVYQALGSYTQLAIGAGLGETFDFDLSSFCAAFKLEQGPTHAALKILEQDGWIALGDSDTTMARAQVTASREAIYDYQLRQPQADVVIKVMLRAYPGINTHFSEISEAMMGRYANLPVETIRQVLATAAKEGLLFYEPQKDKPQLTFTHERVSTENLRIDHQKLAWRKQRAVERIEQSIHYAETLQCRSQLLLAYFGEPESKRCGICDVCTGRNKTEIATDAFEAYEKKIREVLSKEALPPAEVLKAFALKRHETVAKVLAYLLDEQKLVQKDDGNLYWAE
jgi:ATP-dependent DNA helicase RecQ